MVACTVEIGREFGIVPAEIRRKLRERLERICAVLDALPSRDTLVASLAESSLAITVEEWLFRYQFEPSAVRLTVVEARPPHGD